MTATDTAPPPQGFRLEGYYLAVARFGRTDGDPVQNTFYFRAEGIAGDQEDVVQRLDAFYFDMNGTQPFAIASCLSPRLNSLTYYIRRANAPRGEAGLEVPTNRDLATISRGTNILPPEFAIAGSYRAGAPYTARRRGRLFIGPLNAGALNMATGLVDDRYRESVRQGMRFLAGNSQTAGARWVVASRVGNAAGVITEGYVDPHFDVQRRRDPSTETFGRAKAEWTVPE